MSTVALITNILILSLPHVLLKIRTSNRPFSISMLITINVSEPINSHILGRDYGINISVGRVYRLMKSMQLPAMATDKPHHSGRHKDNGECTNHLQQKFNQKAPNTVWASDFTYIKAGGNGIAFALLWIYFPEKLSPGIYHQNLMLSLL